jgi:hypothetical protein
VIRSRAKLRLFEGAAFGDAGRGFMRINLACPHKTLNEAIKRLVDALAQAKDNPPEPVKILDSPSTACNCCSS